MFRSDSPTTGTTRIDLDYEKVNGPRTSMINARTGI